MNQKETYELGKTNGYAAGLYCERSDDETWLEAAHQSEQNARQYSPFEFTAHGINVDEFIRRHFNWGDYRHGTCSG